MDEANKMQALEAENSRLRYQLAESEKWRYRTLTALFLVIVFMPIIFMK